MVVDRFFSRSMIRRALSAGPEKWHDSFLVFGRAKARLILFSRVSSKRKATPIGLVPPRCSSCLWGRRNEEATQAGLRPHASAEPHRPKPAGLRKAESGWPVPESLL
jgi:hypothetical protein